VDGDSGHVGVRNLDLTGVQTCTDIEAKLADGIPKGARAGDGPSAHLWAPSLFAGSWFPRLAWPNALLGGVQPVATLPMDGGRVTDA
jgi:hypothetical protein